MPDMKRFVETNPLSRMIPFAAVGFMMFIVLTIFVQMFSFELSFGFGFSLISLITMLLPFAFFALLGLVFVVWISRKFIVFDKWWEGLANEERAEIEQDYSEAYQIDPCLILGDRYVYIAHIGRPIAYDEIMGIYFRRSKNWSWTMHVTLNSVRTFSAYIPNTSNKEAIQDALSERCSFSGAIDSMLHL